MHKQRIIKTTAALVKLPAIGTKISMYNIFTSSSSSSSALISAAVGRLIDDLYVEVASRSLVLGCALEWNTFVVER